MWIVFLVLAVVLVWFGVDALRLARHASPPNPIEKDEMMFGKGHGRPVSERARAFVERRFPIATGSSMKLYGWLFIAAGVVCGLMVGGAWIGDTDWFAR